MPDRDDVRRAVNTFRRRAEYEYFFSKLTSASWVEPLEQEGRFLTPPAPVPDGEYVRFPSWPETQYLARVASSAPLEAGRVLLTIPQTENVRVHEDLVEIALVVPVEYAAKFAQRETSWLSNQQWLTPRLLDKLLAFARRLAADGLTAVALGLIETLFEPLPERREAATEEQGEQSEWKLPPRPTSRLEQHDYGEALSGLMPVVSKRAGILGLKVLSRLLLRAVILSLSEESRKPPTDYSFIWRDRIEDEDNAGHDVRDALVSAVRDVAVAVARQESCGSVLDFLEEQQWDVFRRIALHVLRVACPTDISRIRERLLEKNNFDDPSIHHEYVLLLRDAFPHLAIQEQEHILSWIEAGPDREGMRQRHLQFSGEALAPALEEEWVEQWQRDRLSPVRDGLPHVWKERFDALVRRHGEPQFDFLLHHTTSGVSWSDRSPISVDELQAMNGEELRRYLREWVPPEGDNVPSVSGVVQALHSLGQEFFERESEHAPLWGDLHPAYVNALVVELQGAVRQNKPIAWKAVLALATKIVASKAEDVDSRWLRKHVADLIKSGLDAGSLGPSLELRGDLWSVISRLLGRGDDSEAKHEFRDSDADLVTIAINSTRARTAEVVVRYALWVKRSEASKDPAWNMQQRLPEVAAALDSLVNPELEPALHVRAVFGLQLTPLVWLDADWVSARRSELFPTSTALRKQREAVWCTYLVYGSPYRQLFDLLKDQYVTAVVDLGGDEPESSSRNRIESHLAEHLMTYYWQGLYSLEDAGLLDELFSRARPVVRRRAIEFVGRSLRKSDDVSPESLERLKALLDWRLDRARQLVVNRSESGGSADLAEYGWWFASGKLDPEWAIERLVAVLRTVGKIAPNYLVAEALVPLAERFPREVGLSLRLMVESENDRYGITAWQEEAREILRVLINHPDISVRQEAVRTIDQLVARRFIEFRDFLSRPT